MHCLSLILLASAALVAAMSVPPPTDEPSAAHLLPKPASDLHPDASALQNVPSSSRPNNQTGNSDVESKVTQETNLQPFQLFKGLRKRAGSIASKAKQRIRDLWARLRRRRPKPAAPAKPQVQRPRKICEVGDRSGDPCDPPPKPKPLRRCEVGDRDPSPCDSSLRTPPAPRPPPPKPAPPKPKPANYDPWYNPNNPDPGNPLGRVALTPDDALM